MPDALEATGDFHAVVDTLGTALGAAGVPLVICSPFADSADARAAEAYARALPAGERARIQVHVPREDKVTAELEDLARRLGAVDLDVREHPSWEHPEERSSAWLFCQLSALDECGVVLAVGGRRSASANLLLLVAEARRVPVLPYGIMGGAALRSLDRTRWELRRHLGHDGLDALSTMDGARRVVELINSLVAGSAAPPRGSALDLFFISYSRLDHGAADAVEMTLRRRGHAVLRDEEEIEPGALVQGAIREQLARATVCIVLWSATYAGSPWCFDEIEFALTRHASEGLVLWIFNLDGTRVVPPRARGLNQFSAPSRADLVAHVEQLLARRSQPADASEVGGGS